MVVATRSMTKTAKWLMMEAAGEVATDGGCGVRSDGACSSSQLHGSGNMSVMHGASRQQHASNAAQWSHTWSKGILCDVHTTASTQNHHPAPNKAPEAMGPYDFACITQRRPVKIEMYEQALLLLPRLEYACKVACIEAMCMPDTSIRVKRPSANKARLPGLHHVFKSCAYERATAMAHDEKGKAVGAGCCTAGG